MLKPLTAYFHLKGIRHSIFINDGRILSKCKSEAEEDRKFVYQALKRAGFVIESKKSDMEGESSKVKEYLGFVINTQEMTVSLTEEKKKKLVSTVEETISALSKPIRVKKLAKCAGRMISTEPALGKLPLIAARPIYIEMEPEVDTKGWSSSIMTTLAVKESLEFFLNNLDMFDNTPIRSVARQISVLSIIGQPSSFMKHQFLPMHKVFGNPQIWAGDASAFAVCAYKVGEDEEFYFREKLTKEEKKLSSGHRELLTVKKTLEHAAVKKMGSSQTTSVYWLTDSENLTSFLNKGSGKIYIQADVFKTLQLARKLNFQIEQIHLLRDDPRIQQADEGTRQKTQITGRWTISRLAI
jgi:hypothetical protein